MFGIEKLDAREFSSLALAYMGDCVYDLYVRTRVMEAGDRHVTDMHKDAIGAVCAASQAKSAHAMENENFLTDEEMAVLKRGRNAKSATVPKNADVIDYRWATGLEALVGYLYIEGRYDRLEEILDFAYLNKEDKR